MGRITTAATCRHIVVPNMVTLRHSPASLSQHSVTVLMGPRLAWNMAELGRWETGSNLSPDPWLNRIHSSVWPPTMCTYICRGLPGPLMAVQPLPGRAHRSGG
jgi:hypothetical protein